MKLSVTSASDGNQAGLTNPGFWGFGLRPNTTYAGSFYARVDTADLGPVSIQLVDNASGAIEAKAQVSVEAGPWKQYEYKLVTGAQPHMTSHLETSGRTFRHTLAATGLADAANVQRAAQWESSRSDEANGGDASQVPPPPRR